MSAETIKQKKAIVLSKQQYQELSTYGEITVDGVTYTFEDDIEYRVKGHYYDSDEIDAMLSRKLDVSLVFTNISVGSNDWEDNATTPDTGFESYTYKATISGLMGVTADMLATVVMYEAEATSGNYACDSGSNSVTMYAKVNTAITIPLIVVGVPIEISLGDNAINQALEDIIGGLSNE